MKQMRWNWRVWTGQNRKRTCRNAITSAATITHWMLFFSRSTMTSWQPWNIKPVNPSGQNVSRKARNGDDTITRRMWHFFNYPLVHRGRVRQFVLPAACGDGDAARVGDGVPIISEGPPVGRTVHATALQLRSDSNRSDHTADTAQSASVASAHLRPPAFCPRFFWNRLFRSYSWKPHPPGCPGRYCRATWETEHGRVNVDISPSAPSCPTGTRISPCSWRCNQRSLQRSQRWSPAPAGWQTGGGAQKRATLFMQTAAFFFPTGQWSISSTVVIMQ